MGLLKYLSYDFKNNKIVGIKKKTIGNILVESISNYQNNYSNEISSIEVDAVTLDSILYDLKLNSCDIPLIKLDIEGAEIEVLKRCMDIGIFPQQILVEFDELNELNEFNAQ